MNIRDLLIGDLVELEDKALWPMENILNKPMVLQRTLEDEKGLIGLILVNRTVELSAVFAERSRRDLVAAMSQIKEVVYRELIPQGYRDVHVFVKDKKFADILVKHFEFEYVVGQALVRRY